MNKHMRFLNGTAYCPEKKGRCKIGDGDRCSHCGGEVKPWRPGRERAA